MRRVVTVGVATLWRSPTSPREVDEAAVRDEPDVPAWLATLDGLGPDGRLGLHGRVDSQLLAGEPVVVLEEDGGWSRVAAPWQPSSRHPDGYPGWVRTAHLGPAADDVPGSPSPGAPLGDGPDGERALEVARGFLGLRYLWGGTSDAGVDCSGLVHRAWRTLGVLVPRDAHDQAGAARPVPLDQVRPGDLYFFARPGETVYHVGFVSRPVGADGTRWMLHAPESGDPYVEDAPLASHRRDTLVAAGRVAVRDAEPARGAGAGGQASDAGRP